MYSSPAFSIIIPAYNAEKYLRECLDSIRNQSYEDFEVIIVDDGSTDFTYAIGIEYAERDSRFRIIKKRNGGVSSARNVGIENATGTWLLFVDSDDILAASILEIVYKSISDNLVLLVWGWQEFDTVGKVKEKLYSDLHKHIIVKDLLTRLFSGYVYMGYIWNKAFRRDLIGNLQFAENIKYNEDRLFLYKYLISTPVQGKCKYINEALYKYRVHDDSAMTNFNKTFTADMLTDLEAFHQMAMIAQERCEKSMLHSIIHCAWYNMIGFQQQIKDKDNQIISKYIELSKSLLSLAPLYKRGLWKMRYIAGQTLRKFGLCR